MAEAVYLLCSLASIGCAVILLRSYLESRAPLLLYSSLCFIGLALNNVLLFVDLVVVKDIDLLLLRNFVALGAIAVLLFGLIRESK